MKHIIIGAGAAGITAAKTIREQKKEDEIVIISTDNAVYSRCMLYKFISGERTVQELSFIPDNFFEDNNIKWLPGVTVTGIDIEKKLVMFDTGSESYDKLLIATGADSVIPPIEGLCCAKNVYGLRNLTDAKAISSDAANVNNIVVIGAGLVGMSAAYSLSKIGKRPTVIEIADHVLPMNLDAHAAANYQKEFEKAGCVFRLGSRVRSVKLDDNGLAKEVALEDGEVIPCDLLVVATSIRPAVDFLKSSGLDVSKGVNVDDYLSVGNGIYAAGDVTGLSGTWPNAMNQGEVAAMNMCGVPTVYSDVFSLKSTMNFFGIKTLAVGAHTPSGDEEVYSRESRDRYEKVILKNDIPIGVILQGNIARGGIWQHMIKNKISVADIEKPIWKISFADAYAITESGEFEWAT